ncbi:hypothetical protein WISP_00784 [Willisornis vidua]|uniref:Uncharacterized protein n=1 Tax=Willisornis vidua TaxID=1566151 RepID=A0ABQ9DV50_9PASS|nr:hypothetical protein WISP_00784 [Willisornis vidua]
MIPSHKMIHDLESEGVVSKTRSSFNSPIWPTCKPSGEWTMDYGGLNEITPWLSTAMPDMLELQYELESNVAKKYAITDIANAFFSIPVPAERRPPEGACSTPGDDWPRGGNTVPLSAMG